MKKIIETPTLTVMRNRVRIYVDIGIYEHEAYTFLIPKHSRNRITVCSNVRDIVHELYFYQRGDQTGIPIGPSYICPPTNDRTYEYNGKRVVGN